MQRFFTHRLARPLAALGLLLATAGAAQSQTTTNFTYTAPGGPQTYTVPAGITKLNVVATGAAGGGNRGNNLGGFGAIVQATVTVVPGEVLTVVVGGQGVDSNSNGGQGVSGGGAGGYNGGGTGAYTGGGGGGATDLRRAVANGSTGDYFTSRNALLVAGAGGAADASNVAGGNGGTTTGGNGVSGQGGPAGQGATIAALGGGYLGSNGTGGNGNPNNFNAAGGGGYYGGGGGGGAAGTFGTGLNGGGGGSSYVLPTGSSNVSYSLATTRTNGSLSITTVPTSDLVVNTTTSIPAGTYNSITVNSPGVATLAGTVTVNTSITVNSGATLNTNCQTLNGTGSFTLADGSTLGICNAAGITSSGATGAVQVTGTRSFSTDANYVYNGTAAQVTGAGLPSQVRNLTSTNVNTLTLSQAVAIRQVVTLNSGSLSLNSRTLTLLSDANGTALVANLGTGSVLGTTVTVQRYIDPTLNPGLGYRHLAAPVANATVAAFGSGGTTLVVNSAYNSSPTPNLTTPFPTIFRYDQSRLASSPATTLSTFDKGWVSPTSLSDAANLAATGFTVQLPGASTLSFTGQVGNSSGAIPLARASGATAADAGLNLIGNPYPSPLDFSSIPAGQRVNMDAAFYTFESTSQYGGNYRSYVNGFGNPLIGSAQAFFVRVSSGQTSGSLSLDNPNRVTTYNQQAPVRRTAAETRPVVQLALQAVGSTLHDDAFVYFEQGATTSFDAQYDAVKLPNSSGLNLSTTQGLSIDGRAPLGTSQVVVPLAVGVPAVGNYTLRAADLLNLAGTPTYLRDLQTGALIDLAQQPSYQFSVSNASALITGRLELVFSPQRPTATASAALAQQVSLYPNPASAKVFVELPASLGHQAVQATLVDAVGRQVRTLTLPAQGAAAHTLDLRELPAGVYVLRLRTSAGSIVKKLTVE